MKSHHSPGSLFCNKRSRRGGVRRNEGGSDEARSQDGESAEPRSRAGARCAATSVARMRPPKAKKKPAFCGRRTSGEFFTLGTRPLGRRTSNHRFMVSFGTVAAYDDHLLCPSVNLHSSLSEGAADVLQGIPFTVLGDSPPSPRAAVSTRARSRNCAKSPRNQPPDGTERETAPDCEP
jgi:hypothetical protein